MTELVDDHNRNKIAEKDAEFEGERFFCSISFVFDALGCQSDVVWLGAVLSEAWVANEEDMFGRRWLRRPWTSLV